MKRKCEQLIISKNCKRAIYIDSINKAEILAYLNQDNRHRKKFRFIVEHILEGIKNTKLYDKEDINEKCKDVTAMKFFKGQENDRIYCKEVYSPAGTWIVVTAVLYKQKKSNKLSSKEIAIIEKVGGYEYEV